jgi:hypothetical protein
MSHVETNKLSRAESYGKLAATVAELFPDDEAEMITRALKIFQNELENPEALASILIWRRIKASMERLCCALTEPVISDDATLVPDERLRLLHYNDDDGEMNMFDNLGRHRGRIQVCMHLDDQQSHFYGIDIDRNHGDDTKFRFMICRDYMKYPHIVTAWIDQDMSGKEMMALATRLLPQADSKRPPLLNNAQ